MSTSYIASKTAADEGDEFTLSTGSSRTFFTVPPIGVGEGLTLQIKESNGGTFVTVGTLVSSKVGNTGVVTARGAGDSTFRVNKTDTSLATQVFFD